VEIKVIHSRYIEKYSNYQLESPDYGTRGRTMPLQNFSYFLHTIIPIYLFVYSQQKAPGA
jgi:hypothetical protein